MVTQGGAVRENIRSVYELVEARLGIHLDFAITNAKTIGTSSEVIAKNNPGRTNLTIVNLSSNTLYLSPLDTASTTNGILLGSGGGALALNYWDDLIQPTLEWHAIASGSSSAVFVIEATIL
tara:strand:+ start:135 stop:500 length:366 start_codon:yes stop_codon:yes gene_type:complete